jgi:putative ABC transport system permease protein
VNLRAPLAPAFLRAHRWAYVGMLVVVGVAATLATASVGLLAAAGAADGLALTDHAPRAAAEARTALESVQYVTGLIAGVGLFFAVFLVGSAVGFVVDGRRRELALLRLAGAAPGQVSRMVLAEAAAVSTVAAVGGAVLGSVVLAPYAALLVRLDLAPDGFSPAARPALAVACAAGTAVIALVGAVAPARRVSRVRPVEALGQTDAVRSRLGRGRVVVGALAAIAAVVLLLVPATVGDVQAMTLLLAAATTIALNAFAPVVIPATARVVGWVVARVAPGAGLVAREHAAWDVRRTAALGSPVLLLVALASALFLVAQTGQAVGMLAWQDDIRADVTAATVRTVAADGVADGPGLDGPALRYESSDGWAWPEGVPGLPTVAWTDVAALAEVVGLRAIDGALSDVGGDAVATTDRSAHVDQVVDIIAPDGGTRRVTIAAVVEPTAFVHADVLAADDGALRVAGDVVETRWFVSGEPGASATDTVAQVTRALPGSEVATVRGWIDARITAARTAQTQGLTALIGGAGALALCAVAQSVGTSARERRGELRLLQTLGAPRRSAVGAIVVEVVIVLATAAVLAALATGAMYARMLLHLRHEGVDLLPSLPLGVLGMVLAAAVVVAVASATIGALWATVRGAEQ